MPDRSPVYTTSYYSTHEHRVRVLRLGLLHSISFGQEKDGHKYKYLDRVVGNSIPCMI